MKRPNELNWLIENSKPIKDYGDCVEWGFIGKLPYRMAMNALLKNGEFWTEVTEKRNSGWYAYQNTQKEIQYSMFLDKKRGITEFRFFKTK